MTVVWVVVGIFVVVAGVAFGVVVRRGRVGEVGGDDSRAGRDARVRQHRYEADRHGDQGDTWHRGRESAG
ncbi:MULTISPECIES: hypothetical protein [Micromonospora]|uniref:hypothetical protein n=1 Tax=Micromonospora TaxID=1873 RepID=UPI001EE7E229|nr:hypothetical protein [Micromonospora hortensis]MCG5451512.1 hypothetical protein [Micromonospora hortensis]WTI11140.1 hypothetical protein OHB44_16240 [Micromonospora sp. NBC_00821]